MNTSLLIGRCDNVLRVLFLAILLSNRMASWANQSARRCHYFADKSDLLESLLKDLVARFRRRTRAIEAGVDPMTAYAAAAVGIDATADTIAARCWVGLLAEAVRDPALFAQVRRLLDAEIDVICRRSANRFSSQDAGAVLAFVLGALVLGAFAPRKTAGFAAPALQRLIESLAARA